MKKKNLKSLKLNKKLVSKFQVYGGETAVSREYSNCEACDIAPKTLDGCDTFTTHSGETFAGGACSYCDVNTRYQC